MKNNKPTISKYLLLDDFDMQELDIKEGVSRTFSDKARKSGLYSMRNFDTIDDHKLWRWFNDID